MWCKHSQLAGQFHSSDCTDVFVSSCLSLCSFGLQIIILDYIGWLAWGIKGFVLMVTKHLSILTNVSMLLLHSTFAFFKCLSVNFVQLSQLMIKRRVSKSSKPGSWHLIISSQPPSLVLRRMMTAVAPAWNGVRMAAWGAAGAMAWHRVCGQTPALLWPKKTPAVPQQHQPTPRPGQTSSSSSSPTHQQEHHSLQVTHLRDPFHTHHRRVLHSWCRGQTLLQVRALGFFLAFDICISSVQGRERNGSVYLSLVTVYIQLALRKNNLLYFLQPSNLLLCWHWNCDLCWASLCIAYPVSLRCWRHDMTCAWGWQVLSVLFQASDRHRQERAYVDIEEIRS